MMLDTEPTHVFRGTWDEILLHKDEIPSDTLIELRVYRAPTASMISQEARPHRSIAEIIQEIGAVEGLPSDLSTNPKYLEGFGQAHLFKQQ